MTGRKAGVRINTSFRSIWNLLLLSWFLLDSSWTCAADPEHWLILFGNETEKTFWEELLGQTPEHVQKHFKKVQEFLLGEKHLLVQRQLMNERLALAQQTKIPILRMNEIPTILDPKKFSSLTHENYAWIITSEDAIGLSLAKLQADGVLNHAIHTLWRPQGDLNLMIAAAKWIDRILINEGAQYPDLTDKHKNKTLYWSELKNKKEQVYYTIAQSVPLTRNGKASQLESRVALLAAPKDSLDQRIKLIRDSYGKEIHFGTYVFDRDEISLMMVGELIEAAKNKTEVYLLLDGYDAKNAVTTHLPLLDLMVSEGITVGVYNWYDSMFKLHKLTHRHHSKILTNGEKLIVGDRNIQNGYFGKKPQGHILTGGRGSNSEYIFTSLDALIEGQSAYETLKYSRALMNNPEITIYKKSSKPDYSKMKQWEEKIAHVRKEYNQSLIENPLHELHFSFAKSVDIVRDPLSSPKKDCHVSSCHKIMDALKRAKKSVDFINPYFLLTPEFQETIEHLIKDKGVRVRLITNGHKTSDQAHVSRNFNFEKNLYIALGIELWEFEGDSTLHPKIALIDDDLTYIGSYNLDPRSQHLNLEFGTLIEDVEFNKSVRVEHDHFLAQAKKVKPFKLWTLEHCRNFAFSMLYALVRSQL